MNINHTNEELISLYLKFKTTRKLADYLCVSQKTVLNIFNSRKIPYNKFIINTVNHSFFNKYSEESCYWAGFIAADGNINKQKTCLSIGLHKNDYNHLMNLKKIINSSKDIKINKNACHFRVTSKQICNDLELNFNITPCKSKILTFANQIPKKYIKHYIRGLIDGDGSVLLNNKLSTIKLCGTYEIVNYCLIFFEKKFKKNIKLYHAPSITNNNFYYFNINKLSVNKKILKWLYNNNFSSLYRKKEVAMKVINIKDNSIKINEKKLLDLVKNNYTLKDLAKHFKCGTAYISKIKKKYNIKSKAGRYK